MKILLSKFSVQRPNGLMRGQHILVFLPLLIVCLLYTHNIAS